MGGVARERERAAAIQAAEEEALRRVQERKRTARHEDARRDDRAALREAQRRVSDLEARVQALETKIAELTNCLQDPELYTRPDGVSEASRLGAVLEETRRTLDAELEAWTAATEALDAVVEARP